jgi:hypothetical protein
VKKSTDKNLDTDAAEGGYVSTLIRKPDTKRKWVELTFLNVDGVVPNFLLVVVSLIFIVCFPLVVPAFVFNALSAMTFFQEKIHERPVTFYDMTSPNRLR